MRRIIFLLAGLALIAAACGGDDAAEVATLEDTSTVVTDTTEADSIAVNEAAIGEFTECIRGEGLNIQDVTIDADGNIDLSSVFSQDVDFQSDEAQQAFETCAPLLEGVDFGFDQLDLTGLADTLLEFAECMRENGFDLPDPDFGAAPTEGVFGDVDFTDPAFEAALKSCEDVLTQLPFDF